MTPLDIDAVRAAIAPHDAAEAVARFRAALASATLWQDHESDPWLDPAVIEAARRLNAARTAAQHSKGQ